MNKSRNGLKNSAITLCLIIGFLKPLGCNADEANNRHQEQSGRILELALKYTGFYSYPADSAKRSQWRVERDTLYDNYVPYLYRELNNKDAWRITLDSIILENPYVSEKYKKRELKRMTIWIDYESEKLLMVEGISINDPESPGGRPSATQLEEMLKGGEYLGFPDEPPKSSLYEILKNSSGAKGQFSYSKGFTAIYSYFRFSDRIQVISSAWILEFRGLRPASYGYNMEFTDWRSIIDDDDTSRIDMGHYPKRVGIK